MDHDREGFLDYGGKLPGTLIVDMVVIIAVVISMAAVLILMILWLL